MALLEYQDARPWAEAIKERVLGRSMPPWFAEPGFEPLAGERVLSPREIDILVDWASGGAPEGKKPAPTRAPGGSKARQPLAKPDDLDSRSYDLEEVTLGASRSFTASVLVDLALSGERHLAAFTIEPENPALLRSALVFLEGGAKTQLLGTWVPGQEEGSWPGGAGFRLPALSKLRVELRLEKPWKLRGENLRARGKLHAKLHEAPPDLEVMISEVSIEQDSALPGARLLAFYPDPALGPGRLVLGPEKGERTLLQLLVTREEWPITYRFLKPPALDSGARLRWIPAKGRPEVSKVGLAFFAVPRASEKK